MAAPSRDVSGYSSDNAAALAGCVCGTGANKIPGFDSVWDAFQTFIRIPGGALLAAGAVADHSAACAASSPPCARYWA